MDGDGNLILVGQTNRLSLSLSDDTFTNSISGDFGAVKLNGSTGEVLWTWTDTSLGGDVDAIFSADTDSNNDIVLGGSTEGNWAASNPDNQPHMAVVKLDGTTGDELWRYQEVAPDSSGASLKYYGSGAVLELAVDGGDDAFLLGYTFNSLVDQEGSAGDVDFFAIKLDGGTGSEVWTIQGGPEFSREGFVGAKVDLSGNVFAAGHTGDTEALDFLVVKLSGEDGSDIWRYSNSSSTVDVFNSVDIDREGNVYIAGGEDAQNIQGEMAATPVVLKLNGANGAVSWLYRGSSTSGTILRAVAVDPISGWVLGAGVTEGTWVAGEAHGGNDFAAVVLDGETGDELARYQNGTGGADSLEFVGFDSLGGLFLGGSSTAALIGASGDTDFVAVKFAPLQIFAPSSAPSAAPTSGLVPTSSPLALSSAPTSATDAPVVPTTSAPFFETRVFPVAPTPSPTSAAPGALVLTMWEFSAIATSGVLVLLLLAFCE